jgi:prolyl-tRNA synthetase
MAIDFTDAPPAQVLDTPDTPTIDTLVQASQTVFPNPERPWTAADTLKNVVLSVTLPTGEKQLVVIGVPGDRAVDLKRVEANLGAYLPIAGEIGIEPANDEDLKAQPQLVKGYIGPGLDPEDAVLGLEGKSGLLYLVDPRIVPGTAWITGANQPGKHVYGLIAGRDFGWDGVIECTEVRAGDESPDGSGPLETARGIEMGHIFQLGRKYAEALDLKVLDANGKQVTVTMGSYGIGVTRAVAALAESNHDDRGLIWPRTVAPADVHVVAVGRGEEIFAEAERLTGELEARGLTVMLDDRQKVSPGVKFGDAELIGVPTIVAVGKGLANGTLEVKDRRSGTAVDVPIVDVPDYVVSAVRGAAN